MVVVVVEVGRGVWGGGRGIEGIEGCLAGGFGAYWVKENKTRHLAEESG